ncbi:MAG: hypothetical protein GVY32_04490 [Gammaproteobacteria bacterium]|nr:hypothetical protein [Gammaproteobacteria bacterium]
MTDARFLASCLLACLSMGFSAVATAGTGATGCADLSGFAETSQVDYQSQIEPIFASCSGCHGEFGPAGLDLREGEAYANLVGVTSTSNPARQRVEPFEPESSALLLAVNCTSPGGPGFQMGDVALEDRALIRDWIAQGALPEPAGQQPPPIGVPADQPWALAVLIALMMLLGVAGIRRHG